MYMRERLTVVTFLLITFYFFYVLGDVATTYLLITHDPQGIEGEGNVFAKKVYRRWGLAGLLAAKLIIYMVAVTVFFYFSTSKHLYSLVEIAALFLIAYSIMIFYNNILALMVLADKRISEALYKILLLPLLTLSSAALVYYYLSRGNRYLTIAGITPCIVSLVVPLTMGSLDALGLLAYVTIVMGIVAVLVYLASRTRVFNQA